MKDWTKLLFKLLAQLREVWYAVDPDLSDLRAEFIRRIVLKQKGKSK